MLKNKYHFIILFSIYSFSYIHSQNNQEIQNIKREYEKRIKQQAQLDQGLDRAGEVGEGVAIPRRAEILPYSPVNIEDLNIIPKSNRHFAYDFFTMRDTVSFWENLPTPANYLLGAGDELVISLWGETQLRNTYIVSREGKIYDEKVGLLNIGGRTIDDTRSYLKQQFGRLYATLNEPSPSTFIDISLGELRSINVNFVGQVKYPGIYPIHPFSNLMTALIQAGGIDTTGSLRNIILKRDDKILADIDLYDYFVSGKPSGVIQLRDQDLILVRPRNSFIEIDSAVVRPGIYESKEGDSIFDMINYAGGPSYDASNKVGIRRLIPEPERKNGIFYSGAYVDYLNTKLINAGKNDKIVINRLFDEVQQVEIIGQVKSPGIYHYYPGMNIRDLFALSGGFNDSTYVKSVYKNRAELVRRNPNSRYETVIELDLSNYLNNKETEGLLLNNLDRIVIHANRNFFEKENVILIGEVNVPGAYPLINDNEPLSSFINRAGGLTSKALTNGISIYRDKKYFDFDEDDFFQMENEIIETSDEREETETRLRVAWQNDNIALMPGDSVYIKEKTSTILVTGEVYNPGVVEYNDGKSLRYYINAAGGIKESGNPQGIIVLYPNGVVSPKRWYSSPKILDGSTVIINRKADETPFDVTQFATNWTSIISSMITAIILSSQL